MIFEWLDFYALIFVAAIMIPNIVYAVKGGGVQSRYRNKAAEIFEQMGRYGCIVFMLLNIPFTYLGFWFPYAFFVYLAVNGLLVLLYCIGWVLFWKRDDKLRAGFLSVLPSAVFLFSGVMTADFPLIAFSFIFAVTHILISLKNAGAKDTP